MYQNVLEMVFFISGGKTMRRPYLSNSNYILKMSNYKRDSWCDILDNLYKSFINKNIDKLYKFRYYIKINYI
jgi:deoxyribodipyrimidine photolyase-related protein